MPDITALILDDHDEFRRRFAALDDADGPEALERIWRPLADLLDLHAVAEEEVFYPHLIHRGAEAEDETLDAVGDHNDIRDGAHEADRQPVGSKEWRDAVHRARMANSEHMAEEEDGALADFRKHADPGLREELGRRFVAFKQQHPGASDLDTSDVDPQRYVARAEVEDEETGDPRQEVLAEGQQADGPRDSSLGLGSLEGR